MELLLGKVTQQAMNYAIRSGITLTASYALKQSTKLLRDAPKTDASIELYELQRRLEHKIRIISPAIDMIELIAARGNTSLESAVSLTKELRKDIERLSQRIGKAAAAQTAYRNGQSSRAKSSSQAIDEVEMQLISIDMKKLLTRIEDAVPLISLALTTSGAKLSTQLPSTVSPSRLLQASSFVVEGDARYMQSPHRIAHVGPVFTLSVYMLFAGNIRPETEEDMRETTWKEVIHKAKVKLRRVPLDVVLSTGSGSEALQSHEISTSKQAPLQMDDPENARGETRSDEFAYQLMIIEDLEDDRVHDYEDEQPGSFDDVRLAGIREMIPIHEISKIFYADTSKVLNIAENEESNRPVLLLRRDVQAIPPRRMVHDEQEQEQDDGIDGLDTADDGKPKTEEEKKQVEEDHKDRQRDPWRLPASLDPEWIALEVYNEPEPEDSDDEDDGRDDFATPGEEPEEDKLALSVSKLKVEDAPTPRSSVPSPSRRPVLDPSQLIKTSLSLLELLLRLTSLQQFQQQSHLAIPDELLNFFLEESASTGAGGNENHRQAIRADARRRVGWDPYDESPLKRRGEDYQYQYGSPGVQEQYQYGYAGSTASPQPQHTPSNMGTPVMQRRSATGTPQSQVHRKPLTPTSNHNRVTIGKRPEWLKKQDQPRGSSPLRPGTVHSDEGIGTSPGTAPEPQA